VHDPGEAQKMRGGAAGTRVCYVSTSVWAKVKRRQAVGARRYASVLGKVGSFSLSEMERCMVAVVRQKGRWHVMWGQVCRRKNSTRRNSAPSGSSEGMAQCSREQVQNVRRKGISQQCRTGRRKMAEWQKVWKEAVGAGGRRRGGNPGRCGRRQVGWAEMAGAGTQVCRQAAGRQGGGGGGMAERTLQVRT